MGRWSTFMVMLMASACVGSDPTGTQGADSGPSCNVNGTYAVTLSPATSPGTCTPTSPGSTTTVTVAKQANGTVDLTFAGTTGTCPNNTITSACVLNAMCSVDNGMGTTEVINVNAVITAQGMNGTDDIQKTVAGKTCTQNFNLTGTRQ